jgi:hypothetical protein
LKPLCTEASIAPWYDFHHCVPTLDGLIGMRMVLARSSCRNSDTIPVALRYVVAYESVLLRPDGTTSSAA